MQTFTHAKNVFKDARRKKLGSRRSTRDETQDNMFSSIGTTKADTTKADTTKADINTNSEIKATLQG